MNKLLIITLALCASLTVMGGNDLNLSKTQKNQLTPEILVSHTDSRLYFKHLDNYTRINILSEDYSTIQSFTVYNNSFDVSSLKLIPGSYTVQLMGEKHLSQQKILIQ